MFLAPYFPVSVKIHHVRLRCIVPMSSEERKSGGLVIVQSTITGSINPFPSARDVLRDRVPKAPTHKTVVSRTEETTASCLFCTYINSEFYSARLDRWLLNLPRVNL